MVVSKSLAQVDLEWGQRCLELQRESPHLKPMPPHGGSNTQQIIIVIWHIEYGFSPPGPFRLPRGSSLWALNLLSKVETEVLSISIAVGKCSSVRW